MGKVEKIPGGKIVYDWDVFDEIRQATNDLCEDMAKKIVAQAEAYPTPGRNKHYSYKMAANDGATIFPVSAGPGKKKTHAENSNAKHNTLAKLLGQVSL